jgi:hypothetical protein
MKYQCPVCFYAGMARPPRDHNICVCCGAEFGLDDYDFTISELRKRWVLNRMPWFSRETPAPSGWDPSKQVSVDSHGPAS